MGVPSGAATACLQLFNGTTVIFQATWPNTAAKLGDPLGGCGFTCPGGLCRVGQNGLPVELLDFYIEESAASQSGGSHKREGSTSDEEL